MLPHSSYQMPVASAISFHTFLLRNARLYIVPFGCPTGHIIPKFLTEAPTALTDLSMTVTVKPFKESALAVARPTIPAPITIADLFIMLFFNSLGRRAYQLTRLIETARTFM